MTDEWDPTVVEDDYGEATGPGRSVEEWWVVVRVDEPLARPMIVGMWPLPSRMHVLDELAFVRRGVRGAARQRYGIARLTQLEFGDVK